MAELKWTGIADSARDANFIASVKAVLNLPTKVPFEFQSIVPMANGGATINYATLESIVVQDADLGIARGVTLEERATVELQFGADGALSAYQIKLSDARHLELVKDNIRKLAATNAIAQTPQDRKPWYIETDAQGRKRLKRAHIS
jgi:hypothetical protein